MTHVFFVRHAQSDKSWKDDRTRPLTEIGWGDRKKVTDVLARMRIDAFTPAHIRDPSIPYLIVPVSSTR